MWHAARQQEKKIKEMMVDHKKRAERRRAYYDSRLGDPSQLLRLTGTARKLHPDAEQHFYHENPEKSLMTWQGDSETKIDRFDGRALLDFIPTHSTAMAQEIPSDERDIQEELNFERFRDLVENERRNVTEEDCLEEIEAEWTSLLDRHKALLKKLQEQKPENKFKVNYGFDYGTEKSEVLPSDEEETNILDEEDILDYVESLTDKDRHILNDMGRQYNIPDYTRLLRVAKRDRQEKANELKETEKIKERKSRHSHGSRKERRRDRRSFAKRSHSARESPTYEPYTDSDSLTESSEGNKNNNDDSSGQNDGFVIQFGDPEDPPLHEPSVDGENDQPIGSAFIQISNQKFKTELSPRTRKTEPSSLATSSTSLPNTGVSVKQLHPRKLTPAEKLRLKTQMGLNKQIQVDEKKKIQKEQQMELERLTQEGISLKTPQPTTLDLSRTLSVSHLQSQSHEKERERSRSYSRSHSRSRSKRSRKRYSSSRSPSPSRLRGRSLTRNVFSPRRHHSPSLDETSMRKAKAKHPVNSRSSSPRKTQRNRNLSRSTSRQRSYRQPPEKRQRNRSHSRSLSRKRSHRPPGKRKPNRSRSHSISRQRSYRSLARNNRRNRSLSRSISRQRSHNSSTKKRQLNLSRSRSSSRQRSYRSVKESRRLRRSRSSSSGRHHSYQSKKRFVSSSSLSLSSRSPSRSRSHSPRGSYYSSSSESRSSYRAMSPVSKQGKTRGVSKSTKERSSLSESPRGRSRSRQQHKRKR